MLSLHDMLFGHDTGIIQEQSSESYVDGVRLWSGSLPGQSELLDGFSSLMAQGRMPHFLVLGGQPGCGQLIAALSLAQTLLCSNPTAPCGHCRACKRVGDLNHQDLHITFPTIGAKAVSLDFYAQWRDAFFENPYMNVTEWVSVIDKEGKLPNITVAECEAFEEQFSMKAFLGDKKVFVIWLPEYLGKEGNKLLKILEEPPADSYIIMATDNESALLPTIRSRAQRYPMYLPHVDHCIEYIVRSQNVSEIEARTCLLIADNNLAQALNWSRDTESPYLELTKALFRSAYTGQTVGMMEWVEKVSTLGRDKQNAQLKYILQMLSLALRMKNNVLHPVEFQNDMLDYVFKLSNGLSEPQIEKISDLIDDAIVAVNRNANAKILMTDFIIQLAACLVLKK